MINEENILKNEISFSSKDFYVFLIIGFNISSVASKILHQI